MITTDKAWRLTVLGGPFPVRAMPALLWVGDHLLGVGRKSPDLASLTAVTFDASILTEGSAIAISYQRDEPRIVLPQTLRYSGSLK
ncbi:MAG: hypothetical protein ACRERU_12200 [Methylococcales bacterium]